MKKSRFYIFTLVSLMAGAVLTSCNDFLDELPDNRMELKNAEELSYLLVNAYPGTHPTAILEWASDNADEYDNTSWTGERFQEQAYRWKPITEASDNESPKMLWDQYYASIENANQVIKFVDESGDAASYGPQLGEALILRAYSMFTLSTVFCQAYDEATANAANSGMPYPEKPQETVGVVYERGTVAELYQKVERDIERAIPLIQNNYAKPKYHFTKSAAYAFAARFYLYYHKPEKAIEYANAVLGSNPEAMLRDWQSWNALSANKMVQPNAYISSNVEANLLLLPVYTGWGMYMGPYMIGEKFTHGHMVADTETISASGPWGNTQDAMGFQVFYNSDMASKFLRKPAFLFEYLDIQTGTGYRHSVYPVFTTDETLLVRAEAKILLNDLDGALADINAELSKLTVNGVRLTQATINDFYNGISYYTPTSPTPKKELHPWFDLTNGSDKENMLQCLLHLRRIVTIHEGLRFQDIKRYGMTIYRRRINKSNQILEITDTMKKGDPRFAFQLPQEVTSIGLAPNPVKATSESDIQEIATSNIKK